MKGVNKVILCGTLGADPETRYLPNGTAVANISVATSERWKDKNTGQQQEKTSWHRVKAFGRLAEIMGEYLRKGSKVYVEGKLDYGSYEKDGVKHYTTDVLASELQMLDGKPQGETHQPPARPQSESVSGMGGGDPFGEEDVPFNSFHKGAEFVI